MSDSAVREAAERGHVPEWTLGDRLRKAREEMRLTQSELAESIGVSRSAVNNAELGKSAPRASLVMLWAMETGVPKTWLESGIDPNENGDAMLL